MKNSAAPNRNQPTYLSLYIFFACSLMMRSFNLRSPPFQAYAPPPCRSLR
uniref:Uncharacterized protein n=1 Tax=Aegilops tauschii subsp. strangulata TaxID=200361 RepID=A0A453MPH4_AEGTS